MEGNVMMQYPEPMPKGFTLLPGDRQTPSIQHKRVGMEAMHIFMVVWLSGWSLGCIALLTLFIQQSQGIPLDNTDPVPFPVVLGFWTGELTVLSLLIYSVFCEKTFHLNYSDLTIQTKLLRWQWQKVIPRGAIAQVVQVQDGGRGRDSFPSWGLQIRGDQTINLIMRQPYDISHWLGQVIASWAKVEFIAAPQRPRKSLW